ncbi:MAG: hypothetical protein D6775_04760 [Caldilineae bacterium]|nr:MAG: hypothetical protein D6775_04760 [Caldilineae bacterium]
MRTRLKIPVLLTILVLVLLSLGTAVPGAAPAAKAQTVPDDEIAYVDSASRIQIIDPYTAPGQTSFTWTSPTGGWTDLAVSDVNADGVDEIVAIGGNKVQLLAPYTPPGTTPPSFSQTIAGGFQYTLVSTGDFVPGDGGRDEILVQRTDFLSDNGYSIQIYDGDASGTNWTTVYNAFFGIEWLRLEGGDIDGLEGDELVMMRNGPANNRDKRIKILKYNPADPSNRWVTIFENTYNFPWVDLELGNTHTNNGALDEIVTTRSGVLGQLASYLVFQYSANQLHDAPNGQGKYFPYWQDIATGDVNNSGDDEVFLIRDPQQDGGISMIGLNYGADSFPAAWSSPGIQLGRTLQVVEMGDVDGDQKAEVVVARPGSYRIYTQPELNTGHGGDQSASFRSPIALKLGNFDGSGITSEPQRLAVSTTSMQFTMTRGGPNPPSQTFQVTNAGGGGPIAYAVTRVIDGDWLQVTPFNGATPQTHTVSINGAGLNPGIYDGVILVTAEDPAVEDSPQQIQVRLIVEATGPILSVSPTSISFTMNFGGLVPDPVQLSIRNVGDGGAQNYTLNVTTSDGGSWLKTSKTSGQTDDTVAVSVDPNNLRSGSYSGTIQVNAGNIEGSPFSVPVFLTIIPTGMEVTPSSMMMQAHIGLPSPRSNIEINQSAAGSGAIHWYAYAVPAGDWQAAMAALAEGDVKVLQDESGYTFVSPDGLERQVSYLPWVYLTPDNGITPSVTQVSFDMDTIPVGEHRVTIIIDGGPGTPNRFQGVDLRVLVNDGGVWLPQIFR